MAEEEDFGGWGRFVELRRLVREDFAGKTVFAGDLEGVGALLLGRVERQGENGLAGRCGIGRQQQEGNLVLGIERVGSCAEDGDVVLRVHGDDRGLEEDRGAIAAADQNIGLATVAKSFQDMSCGEEVAPFVDEEAIAEEAVVVAARGGGLVKLINDGADGRGRRGAIGSVLHGGSDGKGARETGEQGCQACGAASGVVSHSGLSLSESCLIADSKIAAG